MGIRILVGTCGFQRSRRLHYSNLDVVEVQQTFYDPRALETFYNWRREAPLDYEFTVKAWMLVSHEYDIRLWSRIKGDIPGDKRNYGSLKVTSETLWAWSKTIEVVEVLNSKVIVVQTPPSFRASEENAIRATKFFTTVESRGRIIVWEPRGDWWEKLDLLLKIARETGVKIGGDILRGRVLPEWQDIVYARLHGLGGSEVNYRYKYKDEDLVKLKDLIFRLKPRVAYILFNNVYSYDDSIQFKKILKSE
ncbi:MAG: DUF72 domain-containing protein [Acidilobaceae archaeon]